MKKFFIAMLAAIAALGSANANPGNNVVILGDVVGNDGKAVTGSKVYVTNVCTNKVTELYPNAEKGSFEFSGDYCATYILEARAQGYTALGQVLDLQTESMFVVALQLQAEKSDKKTGNAMPAPELKKS